MASYAGSEPSEDAARLYRDGSGVSLCGDRDDYETWKVSAPLGCHLRQPLHPPRR
jgi:hypothetical protein